MSYKVGYTYTLLMNDPALDTLDAVLYFKPGYSMDLLWLHEDSIDKNNDNHGDCMIIIKKNCMTMRIESEKFSLDYMQRMLELLRKRYLLLRDKKRYPLEVAP